MTDRVIARRVDQVATKRALAEPRLEMWQGLFPGIERTFHENGEHNKVESRISQDGDGNYRHLRCEFGEKRWKDRELFYDLRIREKDGKKQLYLMWPCGPEGDWQKCVYDVKPDGKLILRKLDVDGVEDPAFMDFVKRKTGYDRFDEDSFFACLIFDEEGKNPQLLRRRRGSPQTIIPEKTMAVTEDEIAEFVQRHDKILFINQKLHALQLPLLADVEQRLNMQYFVLSIEEMAQVANHALLTTQGDRFRSVCSELSDLPPQRQLS